MEITFANLIKFKCRLHILSIKKMQQNRNGPVKSNPMDVRQFRQSIVTPSGDITLLRRPVIVTAISLIAVIIDTIPLHHWLLKLKDDHNLLLLNTIISDSTKILTFAGLLNWGRYGAILLLLALSILAIATNGIAKANIYLTIAICIVVAIGLILSLPLLISSAILAFTAIAIMGMFVILIASTIAFIILMIRKS